ncbi:B12-binding domain-containing radical SAM protein [Anabaena cylindrica FACHB-243]|uniref:Radical SAM domain protein n=1 Tax=Anabaena cylindrica (strain ATCC 27899 / PCC 7122) TaxID=272123 RepID=K9ZCD1_ANACC|nr:MULTISPECIES: B12-binding domain-containing radical SAM protein [Anabaena]AFZ56883.1 Radical SAM domain protein [Anabaena cylindrica PCC 7122]MBD2419948.1 B12-binding domain-containing radical SAM protein [Anabaena cylindrica FACHB-243]MBY5285610.1 B12-binding domain-containing radical SAM protein [Anabaena sp. CCAP 1446/1C]MCM2406164.1 B12-binding domain-containing radical SAM protein [Anabaena sp. CCAP 1446/1C]BAY06159.1 radical SAM domain-containing protein [Anabaena cylindrica PCC 7122]
MKALLLWPIMPNSFWSYQETLDLAGLSATSPPLGLVTVAAMLPSDWEIRLCDRNVRLETDADWQWCDIIIISAMIIQKQDFGELIQKGIALGKKVAVGGPFPTSVPEFALAAGANYLILDEGECTIPMFLEALERGEEQGTFRSLEKPDITQTPIPRFDLLDLNAYYAITVQFSRGCPFQCEFCDIINLFGRKPRTKTPEQMLAELEVLYQMGWHRYIFLVDDNFIGNKRNAKIFLRALIPWMEERKYPFTFITEASLNLAEDDELINLMVKADFTTVFMGIETPDVNSLVGINKEQNTRRSLQESCDKITRAGLQIMSGFILGFDNESVGAGKRIQEFIEETGIPQAHLSLLQALPNTTMWTRLEHEGRLQEGVGEFFTTQKSLMNFAPTRPMSEIVNEFIETFWNIYQPLPYLKRTFRHFIIMEGWRPHNNRVLTVPELRFFLAVCWRQGMMRSTRFLFWGQLIAIALRKPNLLYDYLIALGVGEHFFTFRHEVKAQLEEQLETLQQQEKTSLQLETVR